jgi:hypothetical protein
MEAAVSEHIEFSWLYPINPHDLFRMVTRLDHLERKAQHLGHRGHRMLELRERDGIFRSITQREVDVDSTPWWLPSFLLRRSLITQHQLWGPADYAGSRRYDARVELQRVPVNVAGEGTITSVEYTATRYEIRLDITPRSRLIPRRIVQNVTEQLTRTIDDEHEFRLLWLEQRRQHT